jgi:hypothetical protein
MASKWSKLRSTIPAFENESTYQQKIDKAKISMLGENVEDANINRLAALFAQRKQEKDQLEAQTYNLNVELEALSQLLVDRLETESQQSVSLSSGATIFLSDAPYPSIEDEKVFYDWLHKNKMDELLSLNHQTLKGMVTERLQSGQPLPPGTKVFLKTSARVRNGVACDE